MEVKMVLCPNGHYYNAAIHQRCPQCASAASGGFIPTQDPHAAGSQGNFGPTIDPHNARPQGGIGSTTPAGGTEYGSTVPGDDLGSGSSSPAADPVVGWLVCVEGPNRGRDYRIHAGYNYIGRESGDIRLQEDMQISRQHHAMIAYDSGDHTYYFGPSGGRNLVRVNGKTVLNAQAVYNYDVLSIGAGRYLFVALCGSHFGWNEGLKNG